jgi:hypothetical protein
MLEDKPSYEASHHKLYSSVLIEDNSYMQKNTRGYCKTALEFIRKGYNSPITIDEYGS